MESARTAPAELVIESATGVDVALQIAGPGARSLAFVIDWNIRAILFVAWYAVAAVVYNRRLDLSPPLEVEGTWFAVVFVPPTVIYFLYHYVLEIAMRGRTPGKRIAGVRVATGSGATPSVGALLIRNLFRIVDSFPLFYTIGLGATLLTRNRVRIGDLAAGTLLVYDHRNTLPSALANGEALDLLPDARLAEIVTELLGRWRSLWPESRRALARTIIEMDSDVPPDDDDALRLRLERLASGSFTR